MEAQLYAREPLGGMLRQRGQAQAQAPSEMSTLNQDVNGEKLFGFLC